MLTEQASWLHFLLCQIWLSRKFTGVSIIQISVPGTFCNGIKITFKHPLHWSICEYFPTKLSNTNYFKAKHLWSNIQNINGQNEQIPDLYMIQPSQEVCCGYFTCDKTRNWKKLYNMHRVITGKQFVVPELELVLV